MNLREEIIHSLRTNERAVMKALVLLHRRQTADEQVIRGTKYVNGRGFNAADASTLSMYAENINAGGWLSPQHLAEARARLIKYAGQLEEEAALKSLRQLEAKSGN